MCAQCNNKKPHIHAVKPVGTTKATVQVEHASLDTCCQSSASSCCSVSNACSSESESGDDSGGDGRQSSSHIEPSHHHTDHDHHDHGSQCCSATPAMSKEQEQQLADQLAHNSHGLTLSWKVDGMDCPSCAAKLEKAITSLEPVETAKVMFATEKLIVNTKSHSGDAATIKSLIEQKSLQTGFTLLSANQKSSEVKQPFWQQHLAVLIIAGLMLISAIINQFSHSIGLAAFTLTTLVGLYPVAIKAIKLAKSGSPFSIETLMSVAAIGALYLGDTAEAAMVILLFLIGEQLEGYAASRARSGVQALMALVPEEATVILPNGEQKKVPASELKPGDIIEVAPGSRLPADGQILTSSVSFDESALTGESVPVERQLGEKVMAGCMVVDKVVRLTIISAQGENAIDRILHLIEDAEARKAPLERFLDKFSRWYTPAMIGLAALVIVVPPLFFGGVWDTWIYKGLTLLLIACPCALVISTPAAITSGLAAAARHGALIKGGAALEQLGHVEVVAFDKTGTLTEGKPVVTDAVSWDGDDDKLLRQAAAVEMGSLHPLAMAVVNLAKERSLPLSEADERQAIVGRGIQGVTEGDHFMLCAADRLPQDIQLSDNQKEQALALESQGKTLVVAVRNGHAVGLIAWRDNLRKDAIDAVRKLEKLGVRSLMLTGDNSRAAQAIASELGNMDFRASLLPEDKVTEVRKATEKAHVAMVGDGINDAPAMKTASIGIAMGGGTDVALETAEAALTHNRVAELPVMIELSRATLANIRQNITLALGLKALFLVTTLLGFTGLWVAVLADSGATALVTLNALRLLKFKSKV